MKDEASRRLLIVAAVLSLTFAAYINTLDNGFAYDDTSQILKNELIRDFSHLPEILTKEVWFWRTLKDKDPVKGDQPTTPYYRPVFTLYTTVIWVLFTDWAPPWHFFSILIHLAVTYFVFLITERITNDLRVSAITTLLFSIHPLRVESVAWICGITDPLLAVFYLPSFYLYMLYREEGGTRRFAGSLALFMFAAFAKEPAIALPILVAGYELFIIKTDNRLLSRFRSAALHASAYLAVAVFYFGMRYYALGFVLNDNKYTNYPLAHVVLTIPLVICKYLGLLFWPVKLSLFHSTPLVTTPLDLRFIVPFIVVLGLAYLAWRFRYSVNVRFGALWLVINLLPVLNLRAFDQNFMVQERYVYIASIGFSLIIATAISALPLERWIPLKNRPAAQIAAAAIVFILFGIKVFAQNKVWKDDMTLFTHGAETAEDDVMSLYILGHKYVRLEQPEKTVEYLERYMNIDPNNPIVINNLASARLQLYELTMDRRHLDRAIGLCERGLGISRQSPELWDTLGHAYTYNTELRNYERAREYFRQALRIEPRMTVALFHLGATYYNEMKYEAALEHLETARDQQPDFPLTYVFLGHTYASIGRYKDAIDCLTRYLEMAPNARDAGQQREFMEKYRAKLEETQPKS